MQNKNKNKGYTIIETMIAVSLFVVVIMTGTGTLINANILHQKSQNMRSIIDNLSFILEDMSRNLRTGYKYHCFIAGESIPSADNSPIMSTPKSCANGWAVSFEPSYGLSSTNNYQWVYYIDYLTGKIMKSTSGPYTASSFVALNTSEIFIDPASSFAILGAENRAGGNNVQQPLLLIKLVGRITLKGVVTPFLLQTSVSQRLIDV